MNLLQDLPCRQGLGNVGCVHVSSNTPTNPIAYETVLVPELYSQFERRDGVDVVLLKPSRNWAWLHKRRRHGVEVLDAVAVHGRVGGHNSRALS
eukprot:SAG11_NODE_26962_length_338_cov_4.895397_1_plen_93_part_01